MGAIAEFQMFVELGLLKSMPRPELLGKLDVPVIVVATADEGYVLPCSEYCLVCARFKRFGAFHTGVHCVFCNGGKQWSTAA